MVQDAVAGASASVAHLKRAVGAADSDIARAVSADLERLDEDAPIKSPEALRADFASVAKHSLAAAYVPEHRRGSMWAHALATAFTKLKIPVDNADSTTPVADLTSDEPTRESPRRAARTCSSPTPSSRRWLSPTARRNREKNRVQRSTEVKKGMECVYIIAFAVDTDDANRM